MKIFRVKRIQISKAFRLNDRTEEKYLLKLMMFMGGVKKEPDNETRAKKSPSRMCLGSGLVV